jgi:hypothetical protein
MEHRTMVFEKKLKSLGEELVDFLIESDSGVTDFQLSITVSPEFYDSIYKTFRSRHPLNAIVLPVEGNHWIVDVQRRLLPKSFSRSDIPDVTTDDSTRELDVDIPIGKPEPSPTGTGEIEARQPYTQEHLQNMISRLNELLKETQIPANAVSLSIDLSRTAFDASKANFDEEQRLAPPVIRVVYQNVDAQITQDFKDNNFVLHRSNDGLKEPETPTVIEGKVRSLGKNLAELLLDPDYGVNGFGLYLHVSRSAFEEISEDFTQSDFEVGYDMIELKNERWVVSIRAPFTRMPGLSH